MGKHGTKEFEESSIPVDMSFIDESTSTHKYHLTVVIDDHEIDYFSIVVGENSDQSLGAVFKGIISSFGYNGFKFIYTKVDNLLNT